VAGALGALAVGVAPLLALGFVGLLAGLPLLSAAELARRMPRADWREADQQRYFSPWAERPLRSVVPIGVIRVGRSWALIGSRPASEEAPRELRRAARRLPERGSTVGRGRCRDRTHGLRHARCDRPPVGAAWQAEGGGDDCSGRRSRLHGLAPDRECERGFRPRDRRGSPLRGSVERGGSVVYTEHAGDTANPQVAKVLTTRSSDTASIARHLVRNPRGRRHLTGDVRGDPRRHRAGRRSHPVGHGRQRPGWT
jgi:hypothetical protein